MYGDKTEAIETTSVSSKNGYDNAGKITSSTDTADIERRLLRKLDYRLLVWSFFGYFANGLDRNNMRMFYIVKMVLIKERERERERADETEYTSFYK
jgi:hypothetical protein